MDRRSVPLLLNPRDLYSAKVYTPEAIAQLRDHFVTDAPFVLRKLGVYFWQQDTVNYLYTHRNKNWEYSKNTQRVPTLILNFASARCPGGNVRSGGHGQEESLCENSTLLASLESEAAAEFYHIQRAAPDAFRSDAMLLSPYVEFFGVDGMQCSNSDIAAVLSVVPTHANKNSAKLEEALYRRIRSMLYVAAHEGYKHLILGAWGCGGAGNDPELIPKEMVRMVVAMRELVDVNSKRKSESARAKIDQIKEAFGALWCGRWMMSA